MADRAETATKTFMETRMLVSDAESTDEAMRSVVQMANKLNKTTTTTLLMGLVDFNSPSSLCKERMEELCNFISRFSGLKPDHSAVFITMPDRAKAAGEK